MNGWTEHDDGTWQKQFSEELVGRVRRSQFHKKAETGSACAWEGELLFVGEIEVRLCYPEAKQSKLTECCDRIDVVCAQIVACLRPFVASH